MAIRRTRRRGVRDDRGVSTVEVVIVTPILFLFILTMVLMGLYAENVAQVQDAAQDAARMGSLQRSSSAAYSYALTVTQDDLGSTCNSSPGGQPTISQPQTSTSGGVTLLQVNVVCQVTVLGFSYTITESSYAPVDTYRGGQP
jgi:Flp pilus assembly protein TadG